MVAGGEIRILIKHVHEDVKNLNAIVDPARPTKKPFFRKVPDYFEQDSFMD